ncbi:nucleoid-associated protein [uncultured Clostridium sp.]|uniref:nucleoid-associated protein n=1 Tax=uncultured Clostridium sp. TaxID=59620 RepID=UPI0025CF524B|nr:nucleoid-associated protein [uncultured Clostridium sp.]
MDMEGNIDIIRAIVHVLDQENKIQILSDYDVEIDERLNVLIINYIRQAFIHNSRVFAKFSGGNNEVEEYCINILSDDNVFISESKKIADALFKAMSSTNASSANLLICKYKQCDKLFIAIMKLDFSENFYTEKVEENGKVKIVVKINGNGFSKLQKLRKCTVINQDIITDKNAEVLVVDTQNGGEISDYYRVGFLNCELVNDEKINTRNMIKEINSYINDVYKDSSKKMLVKTYEFTNILEHNEQFRLDEVLTNLFNESSLRDEFKKKIAYKNIDCEFDISKSEVERHLKNRTLVTENGISLRAKASLFNSNDIEIEEKSNGLSDIIIRDVRINKNKI